MNEQIQKLYKQAAEYAQQQEPTDLIAAQVVWHTKFAELIVRECMEVCKSRVGNSDYNTGRMHCASDLKEHFGVEE